MASKSNIRRPVALVLLDGWGYAPRTDGNAIALAHTPYYDEICKTFPMTTLWAAGEKVGQAADEAGNAEVGHLNVGTGRVAQTEVARISRAIRSGEFMDNPVLERAYKRAAEAGRAVHLIGLLSDGGVHSSTESLFACLRLAKKHGLEDVFIHCILDGRDVPERTADIYVEALEIKLADIGVGKVATLCGRFFAMDAEERWERTARAFTMLVHAEGERTHDATTAIRNSFLRGISDEFISPIVVEKAPEVPVATVRNGDLVIFFNHRGDAIRQLVRSLCVPEGASGSKPAVDTVCLTEYDRAFNLPAAFADDPEANTLTSVLSGRNVPSIKITEASRSLHLAHFFDGGDDSTQAAEQQLILGNLSAAAEVWPESQSFKIADRFIQAVDSAPTGFFVLNLPAAGMMAETGDLGRTVSAIQYIDTCLGGICEKMAMRDGVVLISATYGHCEQMVHAESGEPNPLPTANPVPFHLVDPRARQVRLKEGRSLEDIAPTILSMMNFEIPAEMTGSDLRVF